MCWRLVFNSPVQTCDSLDIYVVLLQLLQRLVVHGQKTDCEKDMKCVVSCYWLRSNWRNYRCVGVRQLRRTVQYSLAHKGSRIQLVVVQFIGRYQLSFEKQPLLSMVICILLCFVSVTVWQDDSWCKTCQTTCLQRHSINLNQSSSPSKRNMNRSYCNAIHSDLPLYVIRVRFVHRPQLLTSNRARQYPLPSEANENPHLPARARHAQINIHDCFLLS